MTEEEIAVVVLVSGDAVLVAPRPARDPLLAGALEFPGGRVAHGETPHAAAVRELDEETGLAAPPLTLLETTSHAYPDRRLRLHFFRGEVTPAPEPTRGPWAWRPLNEVAAAGVPDANRGVIEHLQRLAEPKPSTG